MREEFLDREIEEMLGLRERREKDSELYKIANEVFDRTTKETLAYLHRRGKIETLYGVISTGKEANVFAGIDSEGKRIAVKIYRTYTTEFRRIWEYLAADPRIGYLPKDMRKLVFVWTRREFKNLQRAIKYAVRVPEPVIFRNNVLVMEFVGDETPAPRLKDVEKELSKEDFEGLYDFTMGVIERLWKRGDMVHGDLSEYNILLHDGPVVIDWSQATVRRNRMSLELLRRDITNVSNYFRKKGVDVEDPEGKFRELVEG
ncbi:serine/threonine protein kinase Rio1p homolog [Thermococcus kodakarensis KOD1]|uniref:non-specific serine/threonine protein kinase n=1 Tax=Thermococcus kodakarensis (strain ATCC BAA-918 / JCM 12380 / KOD1) TaxID=69014 RepID=Q5JH79_THEKO|nr:serine protein kinase RIO [Thermococcus kodakarensis]WCN28814.1 serine protein kinase RIO [Thermococcus kodakarensis]WCN31114.1 serine protein kinase RIO [Thermococcus kodakarensis]BAD84990.1 serine/threonine protein kinase Rio1p homolog [Thermococcus kodakarensis KOD1]